MKGAMTTQIGFQIKPQLDGVPMSPPNIVATVYSYPMKTFNSWHITKETRTQA